MEPVLGTEPARSFLSDSFDLGDRAAVSMLIQTVDRRSLGEYLFSVLRAAGRPVESLRPVGR